MLVHVLGAGEEQAASPLLSGYPCAAYSKERNALAFRLHRKAVQASECEGIPLQFVLVHMFDGVNDNVNGGGSAGAIPLAARVSASRPSAHQALSLHRGLRRSQVSTNSDNDERTCPSCLRSVPPGGKFCPHCGARAEDVADDDTGAEPVEVRWLFEELPGRDVGYCVFRGALVLASVGVAAFLVSRFISAPSAASGLGAVLGIGLVGAHWIAAIEVAYGSDEGHRRLGPGDVIRELPLSAALVGLPICLMWSLVAPLVPAHRYVLGSKAAILLTWTPMVASMLLAGFACAHYVRTKRWRLILSAHEFVRTLGRCGVGSLAVILSAFVGLVLWLPLAVAAAAYAGWWFWRAEGGLAEAQASGMWGMAQAIGSRLSARVFQHWASAESERVEFAGRALGLGFAVFETLVAALLGLPYCMVIVVGRLAALACAGRKIKFWPEESADDLCAAA